MGFLVPCGRVDTSDANGSTIWFLGNPLTSVLAFLFGYFPSTSLTIPCDKRPFVWGFCSLFVGYFITFCSIGTYLAVALFMAV